jgi:predicted nucleic acid-binding protein
MIVVADTTPLNHLILIDKVSLLKTLYGRVIIPYAVLSELQDEATPPRVKEWIGNRPDWLEVKHATSLPDSSLAYLDTGERDAIILAQELKADVLLMDDLGGRREAACRNLNIAGTLTVLYLAAGRGLVEDFPATLKQLLQTGFRASPQIIQLFLERHAARKKSTSTP